MSVFEEYGAFKGHSFKNIIICAVAQKQLQRCIHCIFRILVLDKGEVKEFDSPKKLLDDNQSVFYGMARDAGLV